MVDRSQEMTLTFYWLTISASVIELKFVRKHSPTFSFIHTFTKSWTWFTNIHWSKRHRPSDGCCCIHTQIDEHLGIYIFFGFTFVPFEKWVYEVMTARFTQFKQATLTRNLTAELWWLVKFNQRCLIKLWSSNSLLGWSLGVFLWRAASKSFGRWTDSLFYICIINYCEAHVPAMNCELNFVLSFLLMKCDYLQTHRL